MTSLELLPGATRPEPLLPDQAHLWQLNSAHMDTKTWTAAQQVMSTQEQERAQKMQRGSTEYIASRWLMRRALSYYTGLRAKDLVFERSPKGKPFLPTSGLQFSLSHSGSWSIITVSKCAFVGCDIEVPKSHHSHIDIAQRYFHEDEYQFLLTLSPEQQEDYFYRLWTRKEAFLKAIGEGISAGLDKISFDMTTPNPKIRIDKSFLGHGLPWHFHSWHLHSLRLQEDQKQDAAKLALGQIALSYTSLQLLDIVVIDPLA